MVGSKRSRRLMRVVLLMGAWITPTLAQTGDFDGNGHTNRDDHRFLASCLSLSGPAGDPGFQECRPAFDSDQDDDIDLADVAVFLRTLGHLPIPLRDILGNVLTADSAAPYSDRQTCAGSCHAHDIDLIANGTIHQQGRTDATGAIIMQEDIFGDGRWWNRGGGMYGRWSGGGGGLNRQTAGKINPHESAMDMTAFYWAHNCGGCHAGGGGVEFDRDGMRYWDEETGLFGYEALGMTAEDVALDGDYAFLDDADGTVSPAPWNITGVADPECMHCHRVDRMTHGDLDMRREWRAEVLSKTIHLVDDAGFPVPAFAAAGTAGQGWYSTFDPGADPPVLQIDYAVGVADGSLIEQGDGSLAIPESSLTAGTYDTACWGCHLPGGFQGKRGTVWFDDRDVHFRKFTQRNDEDPANDIPDAKATACNQCHPNGVEHNFAKGDSPYAQFRNEDDWNDFRSCRECHMYDSEVRHPDAPVVPGDVEVHLIGSMQDENGPFAHLSCQACHVPYPLERANIVTDRSLTGTAVFYLTDELLSADPLNPTDADKSTWFPTLRKKMDSDGRERLFPQKTEIAIYWADWDQKATPTDLSDDVLQPIILWRVREITGDQPLPIVTDDNDDGKLEVNRPEEILAYIQALKGNDHYGRQVAANPVLVKGNRVWFEDAMAPGDVGSIDSALFGDKIGPFEIFGLDHNVLTKDQAWGYSDDPKTPGCVACHPPEGVGSPVLDRMILIDPFGPDGQAVYTTVREQTGLDPPPA